MTNDKPDVFRTYNFSKRIPSSISSRPLSYCLVELDKKVNEDLEKELRDYFVINWEHISTPDMYSRTVLFRHISRAMGDPALVW